jgi:hypothetical protein
MSDLLVFEREEVQFVHDDDDYVYSFHRTDSGVISFKRLQQDVSEKIITGGAEASSLANTAIIVLCKAAASGQNIMSGFIPSALTTILNEYASEDEMKAGLTNAIANFGTKSAIAAIADVMKFVTPYVPWTVFL